MPILSPNQQCQSTEGKISYSMDLLTPSSYGGLPTFSLTTNSPWLPWGRVAMPCSRLSWFNCQHFERTLIYDHHIPHQVARNCHNRSKCQWKQERHLLTSCPPHSRDQNMPICKVVLFWTRSLQSDPLYDATNDSINNSINKCSFNSPWPIKFSIATNVLLSHTMATLGPDGIPQLLPPLQQPVVCLQQLANGTLWKLDSLTKFIFNLLLVRLRQQCQKRCHRCTFIYIIE